MSIAIGQSSELTTTIDSGLSEIEQTELHRHETVIQRGKQAFIEVGTALMAIRDGRLYKGEYDTFEEYCQSKWGFSRQFANKTIESSGIASGLETTVSILNEYTAREFISVPAEERLGVAEQAKAIAATHGRDTINSRDVKEAKGHHKKQTSKKSDPVLFCTMCKQSFIESDDDCPRCFPPEPETVEFAQTESAEFELVYETVMRYFRFRIYDVRSEWKPEHVARLKAEISKCFTCDIHLNYREA